MVVADDNQWISVANKYGTQTDRIRVDSTKGEEYQNKELPSGFTELQTRVRNIFHSRMEKLERLGDDISHGDRLEMRRDPTIRFASLLKKFSILGRGWELEPNGARNVVTEFVHDNFVHEMREPLTAKLRKILSAMDHGVSITEKDWKIRNDNRVILRDLKTREKELHTFEIKTDDHGNFLHLRQDGVQGQIPVDKVIIFSYLSRGDTISGTSDFEAVWDSWFRKRTIREFWSAYLELRSKINVIGKFEGTDLEGDYAKTLWEMLKNMQLGGRMLVPQDVELSTIDMGQQDANLFFKAMKYYDSQTLKGMLMPQLIGEASSEQQQGSYALGRSHFDVFLMVLSYIKDRLEDVINQDVIRPLVDFNFSTSNYPQLNLRFFEQAQRSELTDVVNTLLDQGVVDSDEEWIRDYVGVPDEDAASVTQAEIEQMSEDMADAQDDFEKKQNDDE